MNMAAWVYRFVVACRPGVRIAIGHRWRIGLLLAISLMPVFSVHAADAVRIGILAFRPKPQTQEQWQPLATALKRAIPDRDFVIEALAYPEMDAAVANRRIDFVLTNPGHYVLLTRRAGLTAPLATLAVEEHGRRSTVFGGVIFTRDDRANIHTLEDIKGKTVAVTSRDSLGGYQMQAYELSRKGIRLPQDGKLAVTGMPHDNVVDAVFSGRADVGFVRAGVLEALGREGKLDMSRVRIINSQNHPDFPLKLSTRLYPEWPFASLPGTDENLARHVAAALFVLEENSAATRAMGIHGFVVPADYTPVADMLKELRMPPFDAVPEFLLEDVWEKYRWPLVVILLGLGVILALAIRLLLTRRKLRMQHRLLLEQKQALQENEAHLQTIIQNEPECIKIVDSSGRLRQMNPAGLAMIEADSLEQVAGRPILSLIAPECRADFSAMHKRVLAGESVQMEFEVLGLKGGRRWLETHAVPMRDHGEVVHLAVTRDITERKKMEDQIRQLAFYDPLTRLPNRRLLSDRMDQAISAARRSHHHGALMILDLDNFKPVNDTHGHSAGDRLLIEVARRLDSCVRETDTVSRLGGDEFVVLLTELDVDAGEAAPEAGLVAEKIRNVLAAPYLIDVEREGAAPARIEHVCTASIGVVIFDLQAQRDDIIRRADMAMYDAKHFGRNHIVIVGPHGLQEGGAPEGSLLRLVWHDSYECGEPLIDSEHRRLFELANALIEAAFVRDENMAGFESALDGMLAHMSRHFTDEEDILQQRGYPDLDAHIRAHQLLLEHAQRLRKELEAGGVTIGELVNFIADEVVIQHMLKVDRQFFPLFR